MYARRRWRLWTIGVAWLMLSFALPAGAQPGPRHVLLLYSYEREIGPLDTFAGILRSELSRQSTAPINFIEVSLQPARFSESPREVPTLNYLLSIFADRPPDLIVPIGGPAAGFVLKYRQQLFPATPMVVGMTDQRFLQQIAFTPNDTAVALDNDPAQVIEEILSLLPDTTTVYVVIGTSELERFWRAELVRRSEPYKDRLTFVWLNELSFPQILERLAALPPRSAIFYGLLSRDGLGIPQPESRVIPELHAVANAPIFGVFSTHVGRGAVGGPVMAVEVASRNTARVASRVLNGESPRDIRMAPQPPGPPTFDWRELRRWNIAEDRLPPGSVVLFREPTRWERYKWPIVGGAALSLVEAILVIGLLVSRVKRLRAERSLRESEERFRLLSNALSGLSRKLMEAQEEERTWVARELHDDVSQRTVLLTMRLEALSRTLHEGVDNTRREVEELCGEFANVGRDIQSISHRLYSRKLELLGLSAAFSSFCEEVAARHSVTIDFSHADVPRDVPADVGLGLYRVLQEALKNAADHSGMRHFRVALRGRRHAIHLEVADTGVGFDPEAPTARHGLGLIGMRERIGLINGELVIESRRGTGTRIHVRVPSLRHGKRMLGDDSLAWTEARAESGPPVDERSDDTLQ
jgi:signal transduction histidine kinase/ABC-type uncharacterized transport system substrate-binding protein